MDRVFRSAFVVIFIAFITHAQHESDPLLLYKQGNWQQALDLYQKREQKSAAVWYNMGNCAYYLNDYSYALTCWLKAIPHSTKQQFSDIKHNIHELYEQLSVQQSNKPLTVSISWYYWLLQRMEWIVLQLLFLLCWFSFIALLLYKHKRGSWIGSFGLCIVSFIMINKYHLEHQMLAVIKDNNTQVLVGPDHHFHALGCLNQADCVRIVEEKKGWAAVQGYGIEGWINTGMIYRL